VVISELIYHGSLKIDDVMGVHIEVLLPAFVLGCVLARPEGVDPHAADAREGHQDGPTSASEQRVAFLVSALFMVLVGLSLPPLSGMVGSAGWGMILGHVLVITVLSNAGKMFPLFCYRQESTLRERLALCIGMWPRGEVGAGVLIVSLGYGISGASVAVATLSLALNLVATGLFIAAVKKLLMTPARSS
jgi:Kef-type K+ transport system membrane component KefB